MDGVLSMISMPLHYGKGPVELFYEENSTHFMGEGQPGQG